MITVCGEGLIDLVPQNRSDGPYTPLVPALGGGPFNVAVAAAQLGATTQFVSRLSNDPFGQALVDTLEKAGVSVDLLQRGDEPTTLAVSTIDDTGSATFTFYAEGTADRFVEPPQLTTDIACFGTVSLALEPGARRYATLLRELYSAGSLIALDPNIRPFYATEQHRRFIISLLTTTHLLKLSDDEVEFLGGTEVFRDVPVTVITRGGDGLTLMLGGEEVLNVPVVSVEVVDTIGAGDTIMASLVAQLAEREIGIGDLATTDLSTWEEILNFAATAAAITCSRKGALVPSRDEVEEFLAAQR